VERKNLEVKNIRAMAIKEVVLYNEVDNPIFLFI
jgi:hypothetical protein